MQRTADIRYGEKVMFWLNLDDPLEVGELYFRWREAGGKDHR
ncbi:MAG TPA: hypothetical protein VE779_04725 [Candidatus Angelobacter sp.]|nr:hypothetical protein [Candidatus Angelobacter sp.]